MESQKCKWCEKPAVVSDAYGYKCAGCWLVQKKVDKREDNRSRTRNR